MGIKGGGKRGRASAHDSVIIITKPTAQASDPQDIRNALLLDSINVVGWLESLRYEQLVQMESIIMQDSGIGRGGKQHAAYSTSCAASSMSSGSLRCFERKCIMRSCVDTW